MSNVFAGGGSDQPNLIFPMKAAAKMFGLGKDDLSEEDWAALARIMRVVDRKNGGKKRGKK